MEQEPIELPDIPSSERTPLVESLLKIILEQQVRITLYYICRAAALEIATGKEIRKRIPHPRNDTNFYRNYTRLQKINISIVNAYLWMCFWW